MKKIYVIPLSTLIFSSFFFISCTSQAGAGGGAQPSATKTVQNVLNSGLLEAFGIMEDKDQFLTHALIDAAIPEELKEVNDKLENLGLGSIVTKEKEYIAKIAAQSVETAKPILSKAVNEITPADAMRILAGGKTAGTDFLRNNIGQALTSALQPSVSDQLESLGVTNMLDNALGGKGSALNSIAGIVLGGNASGSGTLSGSMDSWVTTQLVDGLFNVVENKEKQSRSNVFQGLQGILGSGKSE